MVTQLSWMPLDLDAGFFAAAVTIDLVATPTNDFRVATVPQNFDKPVRAKKVLIDNLANNGIVTLSYGPFIYSVPQFSRDEFPIPRNFDQVTISGTIGSINVIFSSDASLAAQQTNQLLIGQAGAMGLTYAYTALTADYSVTANDGGKFFDFVGGVVAPKNFNLPGITANSLPNGFIIGVKNSVTAYPVLVNPNGTDTINGYFNNSTHVLVINTGAVAYFQCTGGAWRLVNTRLTIPVQSASAAIGTVSTYNHDLLTTGEKFDELIAEFVVDNVNNGYGVGERVVSPQPRLNMVDMSSQIRMVIDSVSAPQALNRNTGAVFAISAVNWHVEYWAIKYYS